MIQSIFSQGFAFQEPSRLRNVFHPIGTRMKFSPVALMLSMSVSVIQVS